VFACVGLCGLAGMISTVAGNALLPATVDDDQLAAANSIHSIGQEAAMAIGAVLGGVTLATGGPTAGLAANLASYALALVLYLRIEIQPAAAATATRSARRAGLRDGLGYVLAHRSLTAIVGGFATVTLATGLVNATLPRFTTNLGLGPAGYGLALSVLATGMVAGEALTGALTDHIDPRWLSIGLAAMGVLFFAFAWSTNPTAALLLFALFGIANGFVEVVMMTGIHQHAERTHQGRVFGVGSTIWRTTTLGAVAAAPAINALASPAPTITLAGICLLAGAAAVCATLRRPVSDLATALT
jgi:MFS family permease